MTTLSDPFGFTKAINWDVVEEHADEIAAIFRDNTDYEEHDVAQTEWESQRYEEWAAEHAEEIAEGEYLAWARIREEDGMDSSREAYDAHIDALVAAAEPD
jgi:hypothetical protein